MPISILPAGEIATSKYARWMLYGQNGVGKTYFGQSIPENLLTWWISADDENTQPLAGLPHVGVTKVNEWEELADVFSTIQNPAGTSTFKNYLTEIAKTPKGKALAMARMADPEFKAGKRPFWDVLVFDTWTRIQALCMNWTVGYKMIEPGKEAQFIKLAPKLPQGFKEWQQVGALTGQWMRNFERQKLHTVFMAQEFRREGKFEDELAIIGPALTPSALSHAKDTLSLVGRLYVSLLPKTAIELNGVQGDNADAADELTRELSGLIAPTLGSALTIREDVREVRKLLVGKHEQYFTKGPTHKLGYVVVEPTWNKLATVFEGAS